MKFSNQCGFTLVELIIVIAIIGISVAIATPMFSQYSTNANFRSDVQSIYAQLQRAKMLAIKEQQNISVLFDGGTTPQSLQVLSSTGTVLSTIALSSASRYGQGVATVDATDGGTNFGGNGITFAADTVTFNSRGTVDPSSFSAVPPENSGYIYVNNQDGKAYTVGIWATGMIVIRQWSVGSWE